MRAFANRAKLLFAHLLGNERWQGLAIPIFSILCSMIAITVIVMILGKNPLEVFRSLLAGSGWLPKATYSGGKSMLTDFMDMLDTFTPMLFAALAVTIALRSGLFNIGVSGQMLVAGFIATVTVGYSTLPAIAARPLVLLVALVVGSLVGLLIGWLKYQFNIHEVVSSIMLNNIIAYITSFYIKTQLFDVVSRHSRQISAASRLEIAPIHIGDSITTFPIGLPLALLAAFGIWFLLSKTTWGLELTAVGLNPKAAEYSGIKVGRSMMLAMTLSGALAGLAGATYYLGLFKSMNPGELTSVGFDSIAVSLLGNIHPLGVILSSLLITTLTKSAVYMSSTVGVRQEITSLIVGIVLLFSACAGFIRLWVQRMRQAEDDLTDEETGPPDTGLLTDSEIARDPGLWSMSGGEVR
ncbi:MAG: ABC transporter permease [Coriobacteriia bacterium]|nr:ABC transporter permease [Coriobacteriia bacterium]